MPLFDVSVPLAPSIPIWPGDPPVQIERTAAIARGDPYTVSRLTLGSHAGTHVDAPAHFIEAGATVDQLPIELLVGEAWIAAVEDLAGNTIHAGDLDRLGLPAGTIRLLLKTRNSALWRERPHEFSPDFTHLGRDAAEWLVDRRLRVVGIDYLSVDAFDATDQAAHHILLHAGLIVIEGLDLAHVPAGPCRLLCLPLKIAGGDAAPARVLIERGPATSITETREGS